MRASHGAGARPLGILSLIAVIGVLVACSGPGDSLTPVAPAAPTAAAPPTVTRTAAVGAFQTPLIPVGTATATIPAPLPGSTANFPTAPAQTRTTTSSTPGASAGAAQPTAPPIPPSTGPLPPAYRIAFVSNGPVGDDIWTVDPDGRRLVDLTKAQKTKGNDRDPEWSPDGTRIAFVSDRDGNADIWVMSADGTGARNLTRAPGDDLTPRWSPDGRRIAFVASRDGDAEIYVMNADGTEQTNLTKADGDDLQPVWSPDGGQLAFVSDRGKKPRALYSLKVDAPKDPFRIAAPPCDVSGPAWSPDGKSIAVVACAGADGNGAADPLRHIVYVVPAAGGPLTAASDPKLDSGGPVYSPDGRSLAFWSYQTPQQGDVIIVAIGGNGRRVVQAPPGVGREPAWSADSTTLAFIGGDFTIGNVIIADAGGLTHNITNHPANDRTPRWSPQKLP